MRDMDATFIQMLELSKIHLHMTDIEISAVLGVSRPTLDKLRLSPETVTIQKYGRLRNHLLLVNRRINEVLVPEMKLMHLGDE